jgi:SAM-dependent methyltransferase
MAAFKDHFSQDSAGYAAHRPSYPAECVAWLASLAPDRRHAVDCGCGNGQMAVLLAEHFDQVTACDASAEQIAHALPHPHVRYHVAPADRKGIEKASADLVVAAQAAHWFDLPRFYDEVRRMGRKGSVLGLICYGVLSIDQGIDPVLEHFYQDVLGSYWPPERRYVEEGYRSFDFPFLEKEAPAFAIKTEWNCAALLAYIRTWSALQKMEKSQGTEPFMRFKREVEAIWGDPGAVKTIRFPLSVRAGHL